MTRAPNGVGFGREPAASGDRRALSPCLDDPTGWSHALIMDFINDLLPAAAIQVTSVAAVTAAAIAVAVAKSKEAAALAAAKAARRRR